MKIKILNLSFGLIFPIIFSFLCIILSVNFANLNGELIFTNTSIVTTIVFSILSLISLVIHSVFFKTTKYVILLSSFLTSFWLLFYKNSSFFFSFIIILNFINIIYLIVFYRNDYNKPLQYGILSRVTHTLFKSLYIFFVIFSLYPILLNGSVPLLIVFIVIYIVVGILYYLSWILLHDILFKNIFNNKKDYSIFLNKCLKNNLKEESKSLIYILLSFNEINKGNYLDATKYFSLITDVFSTEKEYYFLLQLLINYNLHDSKNKIDKIIYNYKNYILNIKNRFKLRKIKPTYLFLKSSFNTLLEGAKVNEDIINYSTKNNYYLTIKNVVINNDVPISGLSSLLKNKF